MSGEDDGSTNLNSANFVTSKYLEKLYKELNLRQIMDHEAEVVKDTQTLHSDMQTLVYENYNKFIAATDTIKQMELDFKQMETEMALLEQNMDSIVHYSDKVNGTLRGNRQEISRLSNTYTLLTRLEFLFKLPATLKNNNDLSRAVADYVQAKRVLQQYGNLPSLQGIKQDCESCLINLKQDIRATFESRELSSSVDLLLKLDEPPLELCREFLDRSQSALDDQLIMLNGQGVQLNVAEFIGRGAVDLLEHVKGTADGFRTTFSTSIDSTSDKEQAYAEIELFLNHNYTKLLDLVQTKIDTDQFGATGTTQLAEAMHRFYEAAYESEFSNLVLELIVRCARKQTKWHFSVIKSQFNELLTKLRHASFVKDGIANKALLELVNETCLHMLEKVRGALQDLHVFMKSEYSYTRLPQYQTSVGFNNIKDNLILAYIQYLSTTSLSFTLNQHKSFGHTSYAANENKLSPFFIILLSKILMEFKNNGVPTLLSQIMELFLTEESKNTIETATSRDPHMCHDLKETAQQLLNFFVEIQGLNLSQMLRTSVETRDWLHTSEPRTVRAVMKRVIDDVSLVDGVVSQLYDDNGTHTERSSDSSRKTHSVSVSRYQYRSNWSNYTGSHLDSAVLSSMHKLFNERIEMSSNVEFNKTSILTGIIKISLKTFMECVRLKTFSKYGLQQIQVDTHYLQLYLWRFVLDENVVHFLLDEVLGSAVHRCLEPVLMEPSVVDIICERT